MKRTEQEISTVRRIEAFIKTLVEDIPVKQTLLGEIKALNAENAILLKTNAELVATARSKTKRTRKQLSTGARYLLKETGYYQGREGAKSNRRRGKKDCNSC